jgi:hypothetical protein
MPTASGILADLKSRAAENIRATYLRHGAPPEATLGVKAADLKTIAKSIRKHQALACELYESGIFEAMYLAGLVADGGQLPRAQLESFAEKAAGRPMIYEFTVPWLAVENSHGWELEILLLGTILSRDEFGVQRDHPGMARRHDRCRQQGVVVIDLAIGVRARQAIRAAELFRAKILGSVPGQENSATQPSKGLA